MGVAGKEGKEYVGEVYKECAEGIWKRLVCLTGLQIYMVFPP